jgi:hypothetical protein
MAPSAGLKMETVCFSETLASSDESTSRQNPEEHHRFLPCLQEPTTGPHSSPIKFISFVIWCFCYTHFNIILPSTPKFRKLSLLLEVPLF